MTSNDDNIDWIALGQSLCQQREKLGMPADVVARQLCLSKQQILALENGSSTSFPGTAARHWCAQRYAALLGTSLEACSTQEEVVVAPMPVQPVADEPVEEVPDSSLVDGKTLGSNRPGGGRKAVLAGFLVLIGAAIAGLVGMNTDKENVPVPLANPVSAQPPEPVVPAPPVEESPAAPDKTVAEPEKSSESQPTSLAPVAEAKPPAPLPELKAVSQQIVDVHGINPDKSSRILFVASREPAILMIRRPGKTETPTQLEKGVAVRITLTGDETVRVAQGKELDMYFQGRKISAPYIEAGNWLRFVPLRTGVTP